MKAPAFMFYPRDWLGSMRVQMMSLEEEGAYHRLLCYCWLNGFIPSDEVLARNILGKGGNNIDLAKILSMFQTGDKVGELTHDRLEAERRRQARWRDKSAQGGLNSAKKRGTQVVVNKQASQGSLKFTHNQNPSLLIADCSLLIEDPIIAPATPSLGRAEEIYEAYPRKAARQDALKAIRRVLKARPEWRDRLLPTVQSYAAAVSRWSPEDQQWIPHPATWFNRGSYEDDPKEWERKNGADINQQRNGRSFEQSGDYSGIKNKG